MIITREKIFFTMIDGDEIVDMIPLEEVMKVELSSKVERFDTQPSANLKIGRRESKQTTVRSPLLRTSTISAFQHFNEVQIETFDDGELCGRIYRIQAETKAHSVHMVKTLQKYSEL